MGSIFLLPDAGHVSPSLNFPGASFLTNHVYFHARRVLSIATNADDKTLLFEIVFCIVWIGGAVIAVNGQLLGGNISFFQSICLLGYCLFPLNMAAIVNLFIGGFVHIIIKLIYVAVAFVWSTYCKLLSLSFSSDFRLEYS